MHKVMHYTYYPFTGSCQMRDETDTTLKVSKCFVSLSDYRKLEDECDGWQQACCIAEAQAAELELTNAGLRKENLNGIRRLMDAEEEIDAAQERIASLEEALDYNVAELGTDFVMQQTQVATENVWLADELKKYQSRVYELKQRADEMEKELSDIAQESAEHALSTANATSVEQLEVIASLKQKVHEMETKLKASSELRGQDAHEIKRLRAQLQTAVTIIDGLLDNGHRHRAGAVDFLAAIRE